MSDFNYPICPVCHEQHVYVMEDEITGDDWSEMFECDVCGWRGDDPDYPEDDLDDAEMNRLAHEALYPEERDIDCPYCGRQRDIPEIRDGRLIYRCAFCDFGSVNVTEDDEDFEDDE